MQWLFAILGLLVVCGAIFNWSWITEDPRAHFISSLLGRTGMRIFYVLLGLFITGLGVLLAVGPEMGIVR